jgi:hypothetical protein
MMDARKLFKMQRISLIDGGLLPKAGKESISQKGKPIDDDSDWLER